MGTKVEILVPCIFLTEGKAYKGPAELSKEDIDAIKATEKETGRELIKVSRKKAKPAVEGSD